MKKIVIIPLIIVITLVSCSKALEPKVYGVFTSANFPKTQQDVQTLITTFYSIFRTDWGGLYNGDQGAYPPINSLTTDEAQWVSNTALNTFTIGPANNQYLWIYYNIKYVAQMTQVISAVSNLPSIDNNTKSRDIGEIKVLRAWLMFILYDLYGTVPVKMDPATLSDTSFIPRPTDSVYSGYIQKDLNDALSSPLPDVNNNASDWGRVSKGMARMLLLKLYMHNKQWAQAEAIGKDLINMGYYSLMPNYIDVFRQSMNKEIIYAVPTNGATRSYWIQEVLPADGQFASTLGISLTPGWNAQWMPWSFYDKYQKQDTRLATIANSYQRRDGSTVDRTTGLAGAIPLKYVTDANDMDNGTYDVVVFRYADVLLSVAEAINEQRGPNEALPYLQQVTDRANEQIPSAFTQTTFRSFIIDERGRELYDEGFRRQDLIRQGLFIPYAQQRGINAQSYQVLFPIPYSTIIQSHGIVTQNPGYAQ